MPELIDDNERLKDLIETKFKDMKFSLDSSFADLKVAINSSNSASFISSLVSINSVYGKKLKYLNFSDFDTITLSDRAFKI
ncbi:MAG: hypothetical protein MR902_01380 [Campylobacter sp.]|nr:hypothetical protein [Campylobacter sp.]